MECSGAQSYGIDPTRSVIIVVHSIGVIFFTVFLCPCVGSMHTWYDSRSVRFIVGCDFLLLRSLKAQITQPRK